MLHVRVHVNNSKVVATWRSFGATGAAPRYLTRKEVRRYFISGYDDRILMLLSKYRLHRLGTDVMNLVNTTGYAEVIESLHVLSRAGAALCLPTAYHTVSHTHSCTVSRCMNVDEARGVCKDWSRRRSAVSAHPYGEKAWAYISMYCVHPKCHYYWLMYNHNK